MVDYVKLTQQDLNDLIELSQLIVNWKHKTLSRHNWLVFERDYLPKLIDAIDRNEFKVATSHDNIFIWILDQLEHSRFLVDGLKPKDCTPLANIKLGQICKEFLTAASRGAVSYNNLQHSRQFEKLFR